MNNEKKLFLKNTILLTVSPFLPKVVNILLLPLMTQYLSDVDFGISGTISAYTSAIGAFSTLGLSVVLQNSFHKTPLEYKSIWRQIYGFLTLWMWIYAVIQSMIIYFCIPKEAVDNVWWIIILTNFSTVFFGPTSLIGSTYCINTKNSWPIVWRGILAGIITIIADFVLIVFYDMGYMGWYIGSFIGTFFSNATYWPLVNIKLKLSPIFNINKEVIRHSLSVSIPTIPHYYTNYLFEGSGRVVLDTYSVSQGEIGRISISQQFGSIVSMGLTGVSNAISPYALDALKRKDELRIRKLFYGYVSISFLFIFMLAIWSKEIFFLLLSNETLASSYNYFVLYIMAFCYRPIYVIVSYYYFFYEKTKNLLGVTFVSGLIAIILYIVLTPLLGVWGFLIGHYLASLYYGYAGYFYKAYTSNTKKKLPIGFFFVLQLVLTLISYLVVERLIVKIAFTAILVCFSVIILNRLKDVFKK